MQRTYQCEAKGVEQTPEPARVRPYSNGVTRTVAYVDGRKTIVWDFSNDKHGE